MRTLKGDIHQQGNEDIIHMMAQGYLVKTIIYRKLEERLTSVPGTEEATGLTGIGGFIKRTMKDMELDAILCTEILQIRAVGLVRNVIHDDMSRLHFDMRFIDTGTLSQQTDQFQGILSTTQGYKNMVTIFQKPVIDTSLIESL